ncbi:MAG: ferritin-like domain-containing protein [Myxococcota bacterium]
MPTARPLPVPTAPRTLRGVALAVLAAALGGCCAGVEDETVVEDYEEVLTPAAFEDFRTGHDTDEERCEAACFFIARAAGDRGGNGEVTSCLASVADGGAPWVEGNEDVAVACSIESTQAGFCTGRRPLGHAEATLAVDSVGTWLSVHAHLECASVFAFDELAQWLAERAAPSDLIGRCRAAARDEVRHAAALGALARRHGVEVPEVRSEEHARDLVSVALHNAVEGCVREAFAAIVASHQAQRAKTAELREVFETIDRDELRHGQLAWDLHAWFMQRLSPEERQGVAKAQAAAVAELVEIAADNARRTPAELGWPSPARAKNMAAHFAGLMSAPLAA